MYAYCIKTKKGMDLASPFVLSAFMLLCVIVQPVSVTLLATAKSAHFMASKITAILCIVLMWIVTGVIAYIGFKRIELHPNKKGGTNLEYGSKNGRHSCYIHGGDGSMCSGSA